MICILSQHINVICFISLFNCSYYFSSSVKFIVTHVEGFLHNPLVCLSPCCCTFACGQTITATLLVLPAEYYLLFFDWLKLKPTTPCWRGKEETGENLPLWPFCVSWRLAHRLPPGAFLPHSLSGSLPARWPSGAHTGKKTQRGACVTDQNPSALWPKSNDISFFDLPLTQI